jgi:predicted nucleic acid-binding protein
MPTSPEAASVVLDTDAASLAHKGRLTPELTDHLKGKVVCVTFVTVGELHKWAEIRSWGRRTRDELEAWLGRIVKLPYSEDVARKWGGIAARAEQRGRKRPVNDTWVAACCLTFEAPLLTLNRKDFLDFAEHEGLVLLPEEKEST